MANPLVDLHIHLLPGLDDGPPDLDAAVALARRAAAGGTSVAVCTPHLIAGRMENWRERVVAAVEGLQAALVAAGVALEVLPGCEVMVDPRLPEWLDAGRVATLADRGRHVLLELRWSGWPPHLDALLFDIEQRGFTVVIAHPERYAAVQREPERVGRWVERGALIKVSVGHLLAPGRDPVGRTAWTLLRRGWVHLLASDGHSPRRPPDLGPALSQLARRCGADLVGQARANAAAVALGHGGPLAPLRPARRFRLFFPR